MNRRFLVPCVASCLGFAVLAGAGLFENEKTTAIGGDGTMTDYSSTSVLLSAEQIEIDLIARWNGHHECKVGFSRLYKPIRFLAPGILANENSLLGESFVGVFTLQERGLGAVPPTKGLGVENQAKNAVASGVEVPRQEFPFVVNRQTGETLVFAEGEWSEFDRWVVSLRANASYRDSLQDAGY